MCVETPLYPAATAAAANALTRGWTAVEGRAAAAAILEVVVTKGTTAGTGAGTGATTLITNRVWFKAFLVPSGKTAGRHRQCVCVSTHCRCARVDGRGDFEGARNEKS